MNWAIHTKGPTAAPALRVALLSELDALLGSEKAEAARQAQIKSLRGAAADMPEGEAKAALLVAASSLALQPVAGIADADLRDAISDQAKRGIDAACKLAEGTVSVTVSGVAGRVDEDVEERLSVQLDKVDVAGMAARIAREAPAESVVTEGSISAPPV